MSSEGLTCSEDSKSIDPTDALQTKDDQVSVAQIKLDELNDILKEYPEDESSVEEVAPSEDASDDAGQASPNADVESLIEISHDVQSTVSTSDSPQIVKEPQKQLESLENSDASDHSDGIVTLFSLPNGYSFDITNPNDCKELVKFCEGLLKRTNEMVEKTEKSERDVSEKDARIGKMNGVIKDLQDKNTGLNTKLQELVQQLSKSRDTLKAHDTSARAAINKLQSESDNQIKSLKAKCAALQKEKEASVMNYARREKEVIDAKRQAEAAEKKCKEAVKEKDRVITQMKSMRMDVGKLKTALDKQEAASTQFQKDAEKWKEESNSHVIKVKWAQNKLKSETDAHIETKEKLAKAVSEIKRAKEETEQIRINCQSMIKTYQESEEMRSNSLDSQLKEKEMLLNQQEAKSGELEGIHKQQSDEMKKLKQQYKDILEENVSIKTKVECLEKERDRHEDTIKGYTEVLNRQKKEAITTSEKLLELDQMKSSQEEKILEVAKMKELVEEQKRTCENMRIKEEAWKEKQQELLEFTQKVSTKNAELTSSNEILTSKLENLTTDFNNNRSKQNALENEVETLKLQLNTTKQSSTDNASELQKRVADKEMSINLLTTQLDEFKDEIRTLKRKHTANVKDLTRQLQQARKKLEPYESATFRSNSGPATEDGSMGSRASSDTSIDCIGKSNHVNNSSHNSAAESGTYSNGTDVPETVVSSTGEISTQTLIERIVRLQRIHAKKNEKIDFLHDHIQQLVDELQKKHKIIQQYILREESGLLMPARAVAHVTSGDRPGQKMSKHLTEEVNKKMQSVLEDTLLRNITLKESLDALGSEIARLSACSKS